MTIQLFLQVLALVLLLLAAIGKTSNPYINLGWAGMACWLLSLILR